MKMHHLKFKTVNRLGYDGVYRLCRWVWQKGKVGDGKGYSAKLSLGLQKKLIYFRREWMEFLICIGGVRIHFQQSFGGIHD